MTVLTVQSPQTNYGTWWQKLWLVAALIGFVLIPAGALILWSTMKNAAK